MLSFFFIYKENYKHYALLRLIVNNMPKNVDNSKAVIYQNHYDLGQFPMWLEGEAKYILQSLQTKDKAKVITDA